eukprot:TRINITY_DN1251_c0_g1_i2.p1 TRINITY_DN1251_c0_g1~~TRINITY_DN1251_c0_g1_i2.p1  ORF type:complete len:218 (-),score=12.64 TRINITY_DN1251_c0_g1_i2:210-863(-)
MSTGHISHCIAHCSALISRSSKEQTQKGHHFLFHFVRRLQPPVRSCCRLHCGISPLAHNCVSARSMSGRREGARGKKVPVGIDRTKTCMTDGGTTEERSGEGPFSSCLRTGGDGSVSIAIHAKPGAKQAAITGPRGEEAPGVSRVGREVPREGGAGGGLVRASSPGGATQSMPAHELISAAGGVQGRFGPRSGLSGGLVATQIWFLCSLKSVRFCFM